MKTILLLFLLIYCFYLHGQNVGINPFGTVPNPSAGLDIDFANKGFLPPRVADTNAISSPAEGLQIYDLSAHCMRYRTNVKWSPCLGVSNLPQGNLGALNCSSVNYYGSVCVSTNVTGMTFSIPYSGATFGTYPSQSINSIGSTGLTATLNSGVYSPTGTGILIFQVSGSSNVAGNAIFPVVIDGQTCNITVEVATNTPLGAFVANSASTISSSSFIANWTAANNANGYILDVATDNAFTNFVAGYYNLNLGNGLNYSITGLQGGQSYFYRVRAYNDCNNSTNSNTIVVNLPINPLLGCDMTQPESAYETTTNIPGVPSLIWITRNLGAYNQPNSISDTSRLSAGCYFQFGKAIAYGVNGSTNGMNSNPSWDIVSPPSGSWQLSNDPCRINLGGTWRIPTSSEWYYVCVNWPGGLTPYSSTLKLHYGGQLTNIDGSLVNRGIYGAYWGTDESGAINAWYAGFGGSLGMWQTGMKLSALPLRCVK